MLDVREAYETHADFVWQSLARLGCAPSDRADLLQETFVVLHRRRADWDGRSLRGWLWGICVGLMRNHRRRAFRRVETLVAEVEVAAAPMVDAIERRRRMDNGQRALAELDVEQRAVFVMFEIEQLSGREISEALEIPLGTVHSRLFSARKTLARRLQEFEDE